MDNAGREEIKVRMMTRADVDSITELDKKIGRGKSQITYKDIVALEPGGPLDFSFIAEKNKSTIGFVLAHLMYMGMPFRELCVINAIDVLEDYQGMGIGRKLIDEVLDKCSKEGISTVRAIFPEKDEKLRKMVENLGFHRSPIANYDVRLEN